MVSHWDPTRPLLLGGLGAGETRMGVSRLRLKRHRCVVWHIYVWGGARGRGGGAGQGRAVGNVWEGWGVVLSACRVMI